MNASESAEYMTEKKGIVVEEVRAQHSKLKPLLLSCLQLSKPKMANYHHFSAGGGNVSEIVRHKK